MRWFTPRLIRALRLLPAPSLHARAAATAESVEC